MTRIRSSQAILALAAVSLAPPMGVLAQRRAKPLAPGEGTGVQVAVSLTAGGTQYAFAGEGTCEAAEAASIYGLPAALSTVRHRDGARSVTLSFWHPKNGSPGMMTLAVRLGGKDHRVSTVKVGGQGESQGSGTAALQKQGAGGLFTIDATAADGARIKGTIRCSAFTALMPAGG